MSSFISVFFLSFCMHEPTTLLNHTLLALVSSALGVLFLHYEKMHQLNHAAVRSTMESISVKVIIARNQKANTHISHLSIEFPYCFCAWCAKWCFLDYLLRDFNLKYLNNQILSMKNYEASDKLNITNNVCLLFHIFNIKIRSDR